MARAIWLSLYLAFATPVAAQTLEQKAQALIGAYPDSLAAYDGAFLIWKDGSKIRFGDGREDKPLDELLDKPDIADMFRWTYPFGTSGVPAAREVDPGRIRNEAFFEKIYGKCRKEPPNGCARVTCTPKEHLERVPWLPKSGGGVMQAASINGAAAKLRLVARDLEALGPEFVRYLAPQWRELCAALYRENNPAERAFLRHRLRHQPAIWPILAIWAPGRARRKPGAGAELTARLQE